MKPPPSSKMREASSAGEQHERARELAAGGLAVARALGEQPQVEARHREGRVEVERVVIVVGGAGHIAARARGRAPSGNAPRR